VEEITHIALQAYQFGDKQHGEAQAIEWARSQLSDSFDSITRMRDLKL
jgi:hypothetical protein